MELLCRICWLEHSDCLDNYIKTYEKLIKQDEADIRKFESKPVFIPKNINCRVYHRRGFVLGLYRLVTFQLMNQAAYTSSQ
jgi:hypothetical protein